MPRKRDEFYIPVSKERLRAARLAAGLSRRELAAAIGMAGSNYSYYENDCKKSAYEYLSGTRAKKIAEALGVSPCDLFEDGDYEAARHDLQERLERLGWAAGFDVGALSPAVSGQESEPIHRTPTRSRHLDFFVNVVPGNITKVREHRGVSVKELCARAGIVQPTLFFIESGKQKTVKNALAEAIADALCVDPCVLFPDYDQAAEAYAAKPKRPLSKEERERYAVELMPMVRGLSYKYYRDIPGFDADEAYSEFLVVLVESLGKYDAASMCYEGSNPVAAYVCGAIKKRVKQHKRALFTAKRHALTISLNEPAFAHGSGRLYGEGEKKEYIAAPYNLEDHVLAREELRSQISHADPKTQAEVRKAYNL